MPIDIKFSGNIMLVIEEHDSNEYDPIVTILADNKIFVNEGHDLNS